MSVRLGGRPKVPVSTALGAWGDWVTRPMSAGAGDAEKVSFRVGEVADD
jgi:hypothetical protein